MKFLFELVGKIVVGVCVFSFLLIGVEVIARNYIVGVEQLFYDSQIATRDGMLTFTAFGLTLFCIVFKQIVQILTWVKRQFVTVFSWAFSPLIKLFRRKPFGLIPHFRKG